MALNREASRLADEGREDGETEDREEGGAGGDSKLLEEEVLDLG